MAHPRHSPSHRRQVFRHGLLRAGAIAGLLVGVSLLIGIWGYHAFAGLGWVDSFYSASMILSFSVGGSLRSSTILMDQSLAKMREAASDRSGRKLRVRHRFEVLGRIGMAVSHGSLARNAA